MRKTSLKHEIERQLLPRLKVLGSILLVFGVGALLYGLIATKGTSESPIDILEDEMEASGISELEITEVRRDIIYLGTASFFIVGASCLFFAWRRNTSVKHR